MPQAIERSLATPMIRPRLPAISLATTGKSPAVDDDCCVVSPEAASGIFTSRTYSVRPESAGRNMLAATNIARARISARMEPRQRAYGISDDHADAVPSERKSL